MTTVFLYNCVVILVQLIRRRTRHFHIKKLKSEEYWIIVFPFALLLFNDNNDRNIYE